MKYLSFLFAFAVLLSACSNNDKMVVPAAPASVADVIKTIQGKNYKTVKLGVLSPFAMDSTNPVNWNIEKEDTSKFFRDYAKEQLEFKLTFSKDSACTYYNSEQKKNMPAAYSVDTDAKLGYDEEKAGIKLRINYNDAIDFGGTKTASVMTLSYLVVAMNDAALLLETGRSFNNRKLVVWMCKVSTNIFADFSSSFKIKKCPEPGMVQGGIYSPLKDLLVPVVFRFKRTFFSYTKIRTLFGS